MIINWKDYFYSLFLVIVAVQINIIQNQIRDKQCDINVAIM